MDLFGIYSLNGGEKIATEPLFHAIPTEWGGHRLLQTSCRSR